MGDLTQQVRKVFLESCLSRFSASALERRDHLFKDLKRCQIPLEINLISDTIPLYGEVARELLSVLRECGVINERSDVAGFILRSDFYDLYLIVEGDKELLEDIKAGIDVGVRSKDPSQTLDYWEKIDSQSGMSVLERASNRLFQGTDNSLDLCRLIEICYSGELIDNTEYHLLGLELV